MFESGSRQMSEQSYEESEALNNSQRLNQRSSQSASVQLDKTNGKIIIVSANSHSESDAKRMKTA